MKLFSWLKIFKNKKIIAGIAAAIVFSFVLISFGVYGVAAQKLLFTVLKTIGPIVGIAFGYFLCVFLPFRIAEALRIRREKEEEARKNDKIQKQIQLKKDLEHKILETLNKKETTL